MICPFCNNTKVVKNGFVNQSQRFKCKACGKNFQIVDTRNYPEFLMRLANFIHDKGFTDKEINKSISYREIAEIMGGAESTIENWCRDYTLKERGTRDYRRIEKIMGGGARVIFRDFTIEIKPN